MRSGEMLDLDHNLRLAAIRKLGEEAAAQELLRETRVSEIRSVKGAKVLDAGAGNGWTRAQAESCSDLRTPEGSPQLAFKAVLIRRCAK